MVIGFGYTLIRSHCLRKCRQSRVCVCVWKEAVVNSASVIIAWKRGKCGKASAVLAFVSLLSYYSYNQKLYLIISIPCIHTHTQDNTYKIANFIVIIVQRKQDEKSYFDNMLRRHPITSARQLSNIK